MKALKRKWNSRRGASILLALLFLLVCVMAGATVVMAAASNAGKIRSNKEEQQKYLTLSSALQLLCDELRSVEYVGQYDYVEVTKYEAERDDEGSLKKDAEGNVTLKVTSTDSYYQQKPGMLQHRTNGAVKSDDWGTMEYPELIDVLPLYNDLDSIIAEKFGKKGLTSFGTAAPYTLKLTVNEGSTYGLGDTVYVTVDKIGGYGTIILHAWLDSDPNFRVRATLETTNNDMRPVNLKISNTSSKPPKKDEATVKDDDGNITSKTETVIHECTTMAVTWKLTEIVKENEPDLTPAAAGTGG